jgi:hypothetical protein
MNSVGARPLTETEKFILLEDEWRLCADSPDYFIRTYVRLKNQEGGIVPFDLWDFQLDDLEKIVRNQIVVVLKARQLGLSWLICAYAMWLILFHEAKTVIVISKGENESKEIVSRIKLMYDHLPDWMKTRIKIVKDNEGLFLLANYSEVRSFAARSGAGKSFSASLLIMDEAAEMPEAEAIYSGARPTLSKSGKVVIISTGNGRDVWYYEMWKKARYGIKEGGLPVVAIFHHALVHPERNEKWYADQRDVFTDDDLFLENYPMHENEAFRLKQGRYFKDFTPDVHVKKIDKFVDGWETYRMIDFGYAQYAVCLWAQIDPMDNVYIVDELVVHEMQLDDFAEAIINKEVEHGLSTTAIRPIRKKRERTESGMEIRVPEFGLAIKKTKILDTFVDMHGGSQRNEMRGLSCVQVMEQHRLWCGGKRNVDRKDGIDSIRKWLIRAKRKEEGGCLYLNETCLRTAAMFEGLERDKTDSEYWRKDGKHDHIADALKYFFFNRFAESGSPGFASF